MSLPAESRGPDDGVTAEIVQLRAECAALRRRLAETEQIAEDLAEELGRARARLAAQDGVRPGADGPARLPLLEEADEAPDGVLRSIDGSDRLVLPIALAATALVAFLVAVLSLANNGFLSFFSVGSLLVSGALARAAWAMRVVPVEVWLDRGVVLIRRGDNSLSFDLTSDALRLDIHGQPGDLDWRVRFYRRGLEPCDVDATMVDPEAFMQHLARYRPAS